MIARDLQGTSRGTGGKEETERKKGSFCAYNLTVVVKMGKESDCTRAGCVISRIEAVGLEPLPYRLFFSF